MHTATVLKLALGAAVVAMAAMPGTRSYAAENDLANPVNLAPNPYKFDYGWAKLPDRRKWGAAVSVDIDRDGKSVWVFDRCERRTRVLQLEARSDHEVRRDRQAGEELRRRDDQLSRTASMSTATTTSGCRTAAARTTARATPS